jgi:glucose/arabinose dehydrogenase
MMRFLLFGLLNLVSCTPQIAPPSRIEVGGVRLEPRFSGLSQPTDLRFLDDGSGRALVAQQAGTVALVGVGETRTVLDLRERVGCCNERGLLSLALHPDFRRNGLIFVYAVNRAGDTVLSRVALDRETLRADPASYRVLLTIPQPGPTHNGGQLQFGPDGFLYLSTGDGIYRPSWLGAPPYAQERDTLLGKLLRFEVDGQGALSVPADNPFVSVEGAKAAIWAYGLRNPWWFSFDYATNELFLSDVGETRFEEVNVQPLAASKGANYGWPRAEGPVCRDAEGCAALTAPALAYPHDAGCSVTGGYVYRGTALPELRGRHLYGDFCSGVIRVAGRQGGRWQAVVLADTPLVLSSFAQDDGGELVALDYAAGVVYQLVAPD